MRYPELAAAINGYDRRYAKRQFDSVDRNGDGIVTLQEWTRAKQPVSRFHEHDLDGDAVLTLYENTLHWAQSRLQSERSKQASREKREQRSLAAVRRTPSIAADPNAQQAAARKQAHDLAGYLIKRYDKNNNNVIDRAEFSSSDSPYGNIAAADLDFDGIVTRAEVTEWLIKQTAAKQESGLELSLRERDLDGDGQLTLLEYAPDLSAEAIAEFEALDRNGDGLLTAQESLRLPMLHRSSPTTYTNDRSGVLLDYAVLVSEIQIVDDLRIADVDVRIELSKDDDSFVDLFLISPDQKSIPLFKGGWSPWRGHIFDDTIIDDDADPIAGTLRYPPLRAAIQPPGAGDEEEPSLADLNGSSTQGRWRLVIRNHNDRNGLLRRWALIVTPAEEFDP